MQGRRQPSEQVIRILGQALTDDKFRKELFDNTQATISGLNLSPHDRQDLEKIVDKMRGASFEALARVCHNYIALHGFLEP